MRNQALCAALLGSALRVSAVVNLDKAPYTGKGWSRVQIKGGVIRDVVAVHRDARHVLDAWLTARQDDSPALLLTCTGRQLSRRKAYGIVCRVAAQAHAPLPEEEHMDVSPRAAAYFLRKRAETTGVHSAREASGHHSDRYLWRDVTPEQQTRAEGH